ncbi:hypothetical protein ACFL2Q_13960 [Thermodesulfobacteriota bacterium]
MLRNRLTIHGRRFILEQLEERIVLEASIADANQDNNTVQSPNAGQDAAPEDAVNLPLPMPYYSRASRRWIKSTVWI